MFLNHEYIGKIQQGPLKVEIYDTGKRTWWIFKKIYAYQMFEDNRLVYENEHFVPRNKTAGLLNEAMDHALDRALVFLPDAGPLALEYLECFEVVQ